MDLTFITDTDKASHTVLGICEHHSRKALSLTRLKDEATITLLKFILTVIERFGSPKAIRTDNEPVFCSRAFKVTLAILGIKHQTTDTHSPWQNGRVERFFGTLKQHLRNCLAQPEQLETRLYEFQCWYNCVRPHQNLTGRTPNEVWNSVDAFKTPKSHWQYVEFWDGSLNGFYPRE